MVLVHDRVFSKSDNLRWLTHPAAKIAVLEIVQVTDRSHSSDTAEVVRQNIYMSEPLEMLNALEEELRAFEGALSPIALAFWQNLCSAVDVARIPYLLAYAAVSGRRHESKTWEYMIQRLPHHAKSVPDEFHEQLQETVRSTVSEEMSSTKGQNMVIAYLDGALRNPDFYASAKELLKQTSVMLWSSFEALATDCAVMCVNLRPSLVTRLISDADSKKYFTKSLSIEDAQEYGFDLRTHMGDVLFSNVRLDRLERLRDILSVIGDKSENLKRLLKSEALWLLSKRRHLIVHRRGIIDREYLRTTSDRQDLGTKLNITSNDIDEQLILVKDTGMETLRVMTEVLQQQG